MNSGKISLKNDFGLKYYYLVRSKQFVTNKNVFDPDKLELTKLEILEFCDRVIKKWNKNPTKNASNILAINAVKTSILWTDDESLKAIWSEIVSWTFDLLYEKCNGSW